MTRSGLLRVTPAMVGEPEEAGARGDGVVARRGGGMLGGELLALGRAVRALVPFGAEDAWPLFEIVRWGAERLLDAGMSTSACGPGSVATFFCRVAAPLLPRSLSGTSLTTSRGSLSSRRPWKDGCRTLPS